MISETGNIIIPMGKEILSRGVVDLRKHTEPFSHFIYHLTERESYGLIVELGDPRLLRLYIDIKNKDGTILSINRTLFHGKTTITYVDIRNDRTSTTGNYAGTHSNYERDFIINFNQDMVDQYLFYYYTLCLE